MGKCKKRNFNKNTEELGEILKREDAVNSVVFDIKKNKLSDKTQKLISLFGITPEELSEAGASLEELKLVHHLII